MQCPAGRTRTGSHDTLGVNTACEATVRGCGIWILEDAAADINDRVKGASCNLNAEADNGINSFTFDGNWCHFHSQFGSLFRSKSYYYYYSLQEVSLDRFCVQYPAGKTSTDNHDLGATHCNYLEISLYGPFAGSSLAVGFRLCVQVCSSPP